LNDLGGIADRHVEVGVGPGEIGAGLFGFFELGLFGFPVFLQRLDLLAGQRSVGVAGFANEGVRLALARSWAICSVSPRVRPASFWDSSS
jgi:hypothetical protein